MESVRSCRNNSSKSESWHAQKEILTVVSAFFSSPPSLVCLQTAQTPRGEGKENERKTKQREKRNKLMQQITISFPLTSTNNLNPRLPLLQPLCRSCWHYESDSLYKTNTSSRNALPYGIHPNSQQTKCPDTWPRRARHYRPLRASHGTQRRIVRTLATGRMNTFSWQRSEVPASTVHCYHTPFASRCSFDLAACRLDRECLRTWPGNMSGLHTHEEVVKKNKKNTLLIQFNRKTHVQ